jgi:hypothetical protein
MMRVSVGTRWGGKLRCSVILLAVLLVGWSAKPAAAETLVFRNECKAPLVVQVVSVFRGVFRRDRPYLLHSGDTTKPGVMLIGDKVITILDAKVPNRILYQGTLSASSLDQYIRILPADPPRVRLLPRAAQEP